VLNGIGLAVMFASALLITAADALIKKTSMTGNFHGALLNPWILVICGLYFIQILLAIYIFINQGELAVYGNLYIAFYSILMVLAGIIIFRENLTALQILGIILALLGAVLINGYRFGI
jgi:drug/metabolite transporter (DMT)-like permease